MSALAVVCGGIIVILSLSRSASSASLSARARRESGNRAKRRTQRRWRR